MNDIKPSEFNMFMADFDADTPLTPQLRAHRRERIAAFEKALIAFPGSMGPEKINEGNLEHFFSEGVYARQLTIPKDRVVVGKIHKFKLLNIITKGVVSVISEAGHHTFTAPYVFVSEPFAKRIAIAHEDTVWLNVHGTHETDLGKIEQLFTANSFSELGGTVCPGE